MTWFITALCVGAGGALGTLCRHLLDAVLHEGLGLPGWAGILVINVTGSLLLGFVFYVLEAVLRRDGLSRLRGTPAGRAMEDLPGVVRVDPTLEVVDYFRADLRLRFASSFVATGFLGGFTTFSSYALYTDQLVRAGRFGEALANATLSTGLGLVAVSVGMAAARRGLARFGRRRPVAGA